LTRFWVPVLYAVESLKRNRRFIGIDINPFSIEHTKFLLDLPSAKKYWQAVTEIKAQVRGKSGHPCQPRIVHRRRLAYSSYRKVCMRTKEMYTYSVKRYFSQNLARQNSLTNLL